MKRAKWRKAFDTKTNSPMHALAAHVVANVPDDKLLPLFAHKGKDFEDALEAALGDDPGGLMNGLSDSELAYCAGWAQMAELTHGQNVADLRAAIREQIRTINLLSSDDGPMSG